MYLKSSGQELWFTFGQGDLEEGWVSLCRKCVIITLKLYYVHLPVSAVARVSDLLAVRAVPRSPGWTPPVRAVAKRRMSAS